MLPRAFSGILGRFCVLFLLTGAAVAAPPPSVAWSETPLALTAAAGGGTSAGVRMSVTKRLNDVRLVLSPSIAPFIVVTPNQFDRLLAGETRALSLTVVVPAGTAPGIYAGTPDVRVGKKTREAQLQISLTVVAATPPNQAVLGPLAGAEIRAHRLDNLVTPVEGPITANPSLTDLALAGTFRLSLSGIPDDAWILVTATGGQDIDADDDGLLDPTPTANLGTLHALARASDWRAGRLRINVLTEIAWQELEERIAFGQIDDLDARLRWIANNLLQGDLTGDGDLDYRDLAAFDPSSEAFRKSLAFPFGAFLAENDQGRSLLDEVHESQEEGVRNWIADFFGDRLQIPPAPQALFTATQHPGEGLTVHFDASQSRFDPRATPSFAWDFGDGAQGSGELASHTYPAPGTRQILLRVNDGLGQTAERIATLEVRNGAAPLIQSMHCRLDPNVARRVLIDAQVSDADGDLAELQWWRAPLAFEVAPAEITAPDVTQVDLDYPDDGIATYSPTLRARDTAGNEALRTCTVFATGGASRFLNDTGLTWGGEYPSGNNPTCTSGTTDISAQDCRHGRDATHNDDSDGHAGFSFTKLDGNGNPLPASASSWDCVKDNVTGLVWENKTDDGGLRDADWRYTSYDSAYADVGDNSSDGGPDGVWAGPVDTGAGSYSDNCGNPDKICTTEQYVADANAAGLCGASDWRMPTVKELENIASRDRDNPAIDTAWFPNNRYTFSFWSSSPYAYFADYAWVVQFIDGYAFGQIRDDSLADDHYCAVRLVRGGE